MAARAKSDGGVDKSIADYGRARGRHGDERRVGGGVRRRESDGAGGGGGRVVLKGYEKLQHMYVTFC